MAASPCGRWSSHIPEQSHAHRITDLDSHQFESQLIISFPFGMCFLFLKIIIDWPKANKIFQEENVERVQAGETPRFTWSLLDLSPGALAAP